MTDKEIEDFIIEHHKRSDYRESWIEFNVRVYKLLLDKLSHPDPSAGRLNYIDKMETLIGYLEIWRDRGEMNLPFELTTVINESKDCLTNLK